MEVVEIRSIIQEYKNYFKLGKNSEIRKVGNKMSNFSRHFSDFLNENFHVLASKGQQIKLGLVKKINNKCCLWYNFVILNSPALGHGWRLGFLGLLHMEVFNQRLDQEYDAQTIMTAPSVTYKGIYVKLLF